MRTTHESRIRGEARLSLRMRRLLAASRGTAVMGAKAGRKKKTIGRPQPEKLYYSGKILSNDKYPHRVAQKTTSSAETSGASTCSSVPQASHQPPHRQFGGGEEGGYSDEEEQPADIEMAFKDVMRFGNSAAGPSSRPAVFKNSSVEESGDEDEDEEDDFDYSRAPVAISR